MEGAFDGQFLKFRWNVSHWTQTFVVERCVLMDIFSQRCALNLPPISIFKSSHNPIFKPPNPSQTQYSPSSVTLLNVNIPYHRQTATHTETWQWDNTFPWCFSRHLSNTIKSLLLSPGRWWVIRRTVRWKHLEVYLMETSSYFRHHWVDVTIVKGPLVEHKVETLWPAVQKTISYCFTAS